MRQISRHGENLSAEPNQAVQRQAVQHPQTFSDRPKLTAATHARHSDHISEASTPGARRFLVSSGKF
jgi:hypothetical protein